MTQIQNSP